MIKEKILTPKDTAHSEFPATPPAALHSEELLFPPVEDSCELTVACQPEHYSASRIARAVEDCDAHLLNLNVTSEPLPGGEMAVQVRAGMRNAGAAVRSLERYGYRVVGVHSPAYDAEADTLSDRIADLLTRFRL